MQSDAELPSVEFYAYVAMRPLHGRSPIGPSAPGVERPGALPLSDGGRAISQQGFVTDDMRNGAIRFTIGLLVPALRAANIDLTSMNAVRQVLVAARFGENLIRNCAELAAEAALDTSYGCPRREAPTR